MFVAQTVLKSIRKSIALALAASLLFASVVYAESGDLDPEFFTLPVAVGPVGSAKSLTALQTDEKIILAGRSCDASCDIFLSRFYTDGTSDVTFNEDGIQTTDLGADEYVHGLAIQGDDRIVVSGNTCDDDGVCHLFLVRYTSDGEIDTTFANDGVFMLMVNDLSSNTTGGLAIRPDGKVVVSANLERQNYKNPAIVFQLNTDGSFDQSFGKKGIANLKLADFYGNDLVIQSDGKIVIAGGILMPSYLSNTAIVRLAADGSRLDRTFGRRGKQVTDFEGDNSATSIALSADGKIALTAWSWNNGYDNFHVAQYNPDGSPDTTFNGTGMVTTDITADADDAAYDVLVQPDGKIVAVGYTNIYGYARDMVLVRYNPDGNLDTSFSTDGLVTISYYSQDYGYSIVTQSDGKYIVAGSSYDYESYYFTLNRVLP